jgi:aspartate racemase
MKTIGLLGGMSWESTLHYYRMINEAVRDRLGGLHSARVMLHSVDFAPIARLQAEERWDEAGEILVRAAQSLERGGADFLVLCTNTMHRVADQISARSALPLLHIADPTGAAIQRRGLRRVGLLGTRFTMEQRFYRERLERLFGLEVLIPSPEGRAVIHRVIYEELCMGRILDDSRTAYRRIGEELVQAGAEGIILGCTEISLLLQASDVPVPTFDTTALHAAAAAESALS